MVLNPAKPNFWKIFPVGEEGSQRKDFPKDRLNCTSIFYLYLFTTLLFFKPIFQEQLMAGVAGLLTETCGIALTGSGCGFSEAQ